MCLFGIGQSGQKKNSAYIYNDDISGLHMWVQENMHTHRDHYMHLHIQRKKLNEMDMLTTCVWSLHIAKHSESYCISQISTIIVSIKDTTF